VIDLVQPEEIFQELEKYEEIKYLSDLYRLPEYKIRNLIKQGYSTNQLDSAWENLYSLDL
jgi:hypothetical protein